jgi:hypothetical protein
MVPAKTMAQSKQGNGAVAVGLLGSVGAAQQVVDQVNQAHDLFGSVKGLFLDPNFLMMLAIIGIGGAIWYWRKQNLEANGV